MLQSLFVGTVVMTVLASPAGGQSPKPNAPPFLPVHVPFTAADPVLDGAASSPAEWAVASRTPDVYYAGSASRVGAWYAQARLDWTATAVSTRVFAYPGTTVFLAHDLVGSADPANALNQFQVEADSDWQTCRVPVPGGMAQIWIFAEGNDADDSDWLPFADGLQVVGFVPEGAPPDVVNDVGFIARLNGDPSTDVHWLPGLDPEPGDPEWIWEDWHHVFGRTGFGQSFQDAGIDPDADDAIDHEVCEVAVNYPELVAGKGADGEPPPWGAWWDGSASEDIAPKWIGGAASGTPTTPFTAEQAAKKTPPIARGEFWLQLRDPLVPDDSPGDPSFDDDHDAILAQLETVKLGVALPAVIPLSRVQAFFSKGYDNIVAGKTKAAFADLKIAFKYAKAANSQGVSKEALLEPLTGIAVLMLELATQRVVASDDDGLALDDKLLRKAYKAVYNVGRRLEAQSGKGAKAKLGKVTMSTRKVFQAATKAEEGLAEQQP